MPETRAGLCREAYQLPSDPPDYVEFGDEVEDWAAVVARANRVRFVKRSDRKPWTAVFLVNFEAGPKYYLVEG